MIPNKLISRQEILGGMRGGPAQLHYDWVSCPVKEATDDCYAPLVAGCLEGIASPSPTLTPFFPNSLSIILGYRSVVLCYG